MKINSGISALTNACSMKMQYRMSMKSDRALEADESKRNPFSKVKAGFMGQKNKNSLLNSLYEQKQMIMDSKTNLIDNTLKNGGNMEDIQEQLKDYEEQLKNLDQQISQAQLEEQQKSLGVKKDEQEKGKSTQEQKTKKELQTEDFQRISALDANISQVEQLFSSQKKLGGRVKVLEREITSDGQRAKSVVYGSKVTEMTKLKQSIAKTDQMTGKLLNQVNDKLGDTDAPSDLKEGDGKVAEAEYELKLEQFQDTLSMTVEPEKDSRIEAEA